MNLKYTGALKDFSGYGEAGRNDVGALLSAGIEVETEIPKYTLEVSDFGKTGEECAKRENLKLNYKIKLLHVTPNVYGKYFERGKYHIGRVIWETDKLPSEFALNCNNFLDEIWTASEFNKSAILKAGVTVPIFVIPEAIEEVEIPKQYLTINQKTFKFYSMFEWTERKNPKALLEAYWREFGSSDSVSLTIKTYVDSFRPEKQREIDEYVRRIKNKLNLNYYAPVYLYKELMDRHQIFKFHSTFDCFVSTHRGEGWGIPQVEAMLMGKPIISTNCGGCHEWLTDNNNAFLLDYKLIPLLENTRNQCWYTQDQNWAEVDVDEVKQKMRYVFDNRDFAKAVGIRARKNVIEKFGFETVGKIMAERLKVINKKL